MSTADQYRFVAVVAIALVILLAVIAVAILTRQPVDDVEIPEDMDAELARLIEEEDARQRAFPPDSGSVRGWAAGLVAIAGLALCGLITFVVVILGKASI